VSIKEIEKAKLC
jgi:hypothetical protein